MWNSRPAASTNSKPGTLPGFSFCTTRSYRSTIRAKNQLSACSAAYLAGLIDADGTVTLVRKHRNENRHLAISVSNTDRDLLEFVLRSIGAGKITSKRVAKREHTPSFTFTIYNRQALHLLERIQPFLKTYKAQRANVILRDYLPLTPRNGKYTDDLRQARENFEKNVLAVKPRRAASSEG